MFALKTNRGRATAIAGAAALIAAGIVGVTGSSASAAAGTYTASPATGPFNGNTVLTVTGKGFKSAGGASKVAATANTGVQLATSCGTSTTTSVGKVTSGITSFSVTSATKMVVTVNPGGATTDAKTAYKVCVYALTGNGLLGSTTWTAYPTPTITHINNIAVAADAPLPNYGGTTVALDGTKFSAKATVTVGGVAATNVKFIDDTSLTFTAPAGTSTDQAVIVTTEGGKSAATGTEIDYITAITVSPTTGKPAGGEALTVTGKGFATLFVVGTNPNAGVLFQTTAQVPWAGAEAASVAIGAITVVSDTEIVFDAPALAAGAYTIAVTNDITDADGAGLTTLTTASADSTYTYATF